MCVECCCSKTNYTHLLKPLGSTGNRMRSVEKKKKQTSGLNPRSFLELAHCLFGERAGFLSLVLIFFYPFPCWKDSHAESCSLLCVTYNWASPQLPESSVASCLLDCLGFSRATHRSLSNYRKFMWLLVLYNTSSGHLEHSLLPLNIDLWCKCAAIESHTCLNFIENASQCLNSKL